MNEFKKTFVHVISTLIALFDSDTYLHSYAVCAIIQTVVHAYIHTIYTAC